jgi:hypothetical protein
LISGELRPFRAALQQENAGAAAAAADGIDMTNKSARSPGFSASGGSMGRFP